MTITIHPKNEQHWLDLRSEDITSTEVSALFDCSPYQTKFELYHAKKNKTVLEFEETDRTKWGKRLQDAIAAGIAEDLGLKIRPMTEYCRHSDVPHMGSSFDFEIISSDRPEPGILEIKNIDSLIFKNTWIVDGDFVEAPPHIEMQLQHQLEVKNYNWGIIGAFVGGNKPIIVNRDRDLEIGAMIKSAVAGFWADVKAGIEPKPDYERDAEIIRKIYGSAAGEPIITSDLRIFELCSRYKEITEIMGNLGKEKDATKSELLTMIGDAPKVFAGDYTISAAQINRKGYVVNDTSYRDFRITKKKG